jgi:hypothetical protein
VQPCECLEGCKRGKETETKVYIQRRRFHKGFHRWKYNALVSRAFDFGPIAIPFPLLLERAHTPLDVAVPILFLGMSAPPDDDRASASLQIPDILRKGVPMLKVSAKKVQQRLVRIAPEEGRILWESRKGGSSK